MLNLFTARRSWSDILAGLVFRGPGVPAPVTPGKATGSVALVGAGPGDPELITLRALRLLQQADVVVYDRLVAPALLLECRADALLVDVGKRPGRHTLPQDGIEALLVAHALQGRRVVRLKGGDPFIFGRGGEELATLRQAGIAVEVVPGITAAAGCAAAAGFPLTQRNIADSVCLATAHFADGEDHTNWAALAADPGRTLVFYMGLARLATIRSQLLHHGLERTTPAALIEHGTTPAHREVICTLDTLVSAAGAAALASPTLLVVGHVVALSETAVRAGMTVSSAVPA